MESESEIRTAMRASFEASLDRRVDRAASIPLQNFIPSHWFSAAASECAQMYVSGFFYGCISISQAYVEALSQFLAKHHGIRQTKAVNIRWQRLRDSRHVPEVVRDAAQIVYSDRNNFHHLNAGVVQDYELLQVRAGDCIKNLHIIESSIFGYSVSADQPGQLVLDNPSYWPAESPEHVRAFIRQLWV